MSDSATPLDAAGHAPGLAELLARQQLYRRLEADLRRQLPAALAGRIDVSCVHDGGELVLFAPHGAAATRLRATQQRLLTTQVLAGTGSSADAKVQQWIGRDDAALRFTLGMLSELATQTSLDYPTASVAVRRLAQLASAG